MRAFSDVIGLLPSWLDPETLLTTLLANYGSITFWVVVAIIFAECGLLIGFFLPGDSLLFITGLFIAGTASGARIDMSIWLAVVVLVAAAVLGNIVGYWIGHEAGPPLFRKPDSRLFKREYVERTHAFFDRYGSRAIVLARFVPIVRTFITAIAGVARMDYGRYVTFSAIGGIVWAGGVTLLGYYLGNVPFVSRNIELMLVLVVLLSVIPLIWEYLRHRRSRDAGTA